jgi:hypothetical protein
MQTLMKITEMRGWPGICFEAFIVCIEGGRTLYYCDLTTVLEAVASKDF